MNKKEFEELLKHNSKENKKSMKLIKENSKKFHKLIEEIQIGLGYHNLRK